MDQLWKILAGATFGYQNTMAKRMSSVPTTIAPRTIIAKRAIRPRPTSVSIATV